MKFKLTQILYGNNFLCSGNINCKTSISYALIFKMIEKHYHTKDKKFIFTPSTLENNNWNWNS